MGTTIPRTGDLLTDAKELGRGLMRGNALECKLGYSWENAVTAAIDYYDMIAWSPERDADNWTPEKEAEVRAYLHGFAVGLHRIGDNAANDAMARELYGEGIGNESGDALQAFFDGENAGYEEPEELICPASAETAEDATQRKRREALTMRECGCGATKPGECCAAVEGYYTSIGQRHDHELVSLYEGDGCEAARVAINHRKEAAR